MTLQFKASKKMKFSAFILKLSAVAATAVTAATLAIPQVQSQSRPIIKVDGSSTVYPITEAVAESFQATEKSRGGARVTVGISGTGGGFKKFCSKNKAVRTHISNASRRIKDSEKKMCEEANGSGVKGVQYIEIPVAYDAITVVVNKKNPLTNITTEELKKMWEPGAKDSISKWNQVNSSWPNKNLDLFGPGTDSGTFDYFTKKIVGKSGASRSDYIPSEDDNVLVKGVVDNENSLAYFGFTYFTENASKLKALAINDVKPSLETVKDGSYKPLSRPIFIYVNTDAAKDNPALRKFVRYYLDNAEKMVTKVRSIPRDDYQTSKSKFNDAIK